MLFSIPFAMVVVSLLSASPLKTTKKKSTRLPVDSSQLLPVAVAEPDSLFGMVKVGPSQSASWIAFRNLGAWTPEIAAQIQTDNKMANLDHLEIGTLLKLRHTLDQRKLTAAQQITKAIRKAVITYVKGSAEVRRAGTPPHALQANEFLSPGDRVTTSSGSVVEMIIDNQSVLRLRDKTTLLLESIQDSSASQKAKTSVYLEVGWVWTKVRKWAGPLVGFQVKMPNAIAGVHGTTFECFVGEDSAGLVTVFEGSVGVSSRLKPSEIPVGTGKSVSVKKDGELSAPQPSSQTTPEWQHYNEQQDKALETPAPTPASDALGARQPVGEGSALLPEPSTKHEPHRL